MSTSSSTASTRTPLSGFSAAPAPAFVSFVVMTPSSSVKLPMITASRPARSTPARGRHREHEPAVRARGQSHVAAHRAGQYPRRRQAQTMALPAAGGGIGALRPPLEDALPILGGNAGPVVFDGDAGDPV